MHLLGRASIYPRGELIMSSKGITSGGCCGAQYRSLSVFRVRATISLSFFLFFFCSLPHPHLGPLPRREARRARKSAYHSSRPLTLTADEGEGGETLARTMYIHAGKSWPRNKPPLREREKFHSLSLSGSSYFNEREI